MCILIVEDELIVAADIRMQLQDFGFETCHIASNYSEAIKLLETTPVHLALLDIHLGGHKTGIDVANHISAHQSIPYIFLTSHEDLSTINAALSTAPSAYLSKPFKTSSLYAAIQLAIQTFNKRQNSDATDDDNLIIGDSLFVKDRSNYVRVPLRDIQYIHSEGNYMELHTTQRKYLLRIPQKTLLAQLPGTFLKVHKSYIVNCDVVNTVGVESVSLPIANVPLSASYKAGLLDKLKVN